MSKGLTPPLKGSSTAAGCSPMAFDVIRKLKQPRPILDWSFRLAGVLSLLLLCSLCSYLLLYEYKAGRVVEIVRKGEFLTGEEDCNIFDGKWVWDDGYPLYRPQDCPFLDPGFRCSENGRLDTMYTKWRWQPNNCNLPRFDAKDMLQRLRNRRLVFVGDSIGRNQWESLLCMLSSAVADKSKIFEVNGNPITKHNGFLVFKFSDFNCTIEYYRAPFLVVQGRPPSGVPKKVITTLRLDKMDWTSSRWKDADLLVFNTGHWWNKEKTIKGGCYFQEGKDLKMEMSIEHAYMRSIETLVEWVEKVVNTNKTHVIYRTYSPVHFSGGDWKHGGSCHMETFPELEQSKRDVRRPWVPMLNILRDVLAKHNMTEIGVLNVSSLTDRRKDGHSSVYYLGPGNPSALHRQDCSHWCLPGVPDAWNELLYAIFLRRESAKNRPF